MATRGNRKPFRTPKVLLMSLAALVSGARAEQMQQFGDWQVHYVVLPSEFLQPATAARYGIVRGRGRAFINISVLDPRGRPTRVDMAGQVINLLGQRHDLEFREIMEGDAVYYLAVMKHTDEETLRFRIRIAAPGRAGNMELAFQQKLYAEEP